MRRTNKENDLFNPSPPELRSFGLSPIPLRNTGEKVKYFLSYRQAHNKRMPQNSPLPCPAAFRGVTYRIGAEAKRKYISPSSSVFCAAKYRGGGRRTEGLKKHRQRQQQNQVSNSPLPCPAALRDATKQHREKDHFSILSPCVAQPYRGSARRARGLKRQRG